MNGYCRSVRWTGVSSVAMATTVLLLCSGRGESAQIAPNPNPAGNTISVSGTDSNEDLAFDNFGRIDILPDALLTNHTNLLNRFESRLENEGMFVNRHLLDNLGSVRNGPDGRLVNEEESLINNLGEVVNQSEVTVEFASSFFNQASGTLINEEAATFDCFGTLDNRSGALIINLGMLTIRGFLVNSGTMNNSGTVLIETGMFDNTNGVLNNDDGGTIMLVHHLTLDDSHTINLNAGGTFFNRRTLINVAGHSQINHGILVTKGQAL